MKFQLQWNLPVSRFVYTCDNNCSHIIIVASNFAHCCKITAIFPKFFLPFVHCMRVLGSTVVSPYVGMARKQNGGYNASISVQTLIFHLVVNSTRLKTVRSALWRCPNSTVALRLLENVVKVTNQEVVKIEFRHLPFLLLLSFFLLLQPA